MTDSRITLKNRPLAGVLAFLVPGLGHLYQGRRFKAAVYFVCIVGLFLTGMVMADWKAVQPPGRIALGRLTIFDDGRLDGAGGSLRSLKFAAQASLGLPAITSLIQNKRWQAAGRLPVRTLEAPLSANFQGNLLYYADDGLQEGPIRGTISLEPVAGPFGGSGIGGTFAGLRDGQPVNLKISGPVELGPEFGADRERPVYAPLVDPESGREVGRLDGWIPRPLQHHLFVTMTPGEEHDLQQQLGKRHELAMVLTWIAGLLNILAIWDAVEGPAYGYDDKEQPEQPPTA